MRKIVKALFVFLNAQWKTQARKMKSMSDKFYSKVSVGITIRIRVPEVDGGRGDARVFLAVKLKKLKIEFVDKGHGNAEPSNYILRLSSVYVSKNEFPLKKFEILRQRFDLFAIIFRSKFAAADKDFKSVRVKHRVILKNVLVSKITCNAFLSVTTAILVLIKN